MASLRHDMGVQFNQFMEGRFNQMINSTPKDRQTDAQPEDPAPTPQNSTPRVQQLEKATPTYEEESNNLEADPEPSED